METIAEWTERVTASLPVKPYYAEDGIIILHSDCRDILPHLPKVDLVLTDPPYGIGSSWGANATGGFMTAERAKETRAWDGKAPSKEVFDALLQACNEAVVWGGNYLPLPPTQRVFVWDKCQQGMHFAEAEIAWVRSTAGTTRLCRLPLKSQEIFGQESQRKHPTQKPIKLMTWCLSFFPDAQTILDPFMGSGTTLVAAKQLGRKAIGIELEEKYVKIAIERLAQKVLDFGQEVRS